MKPDTIIRKSSSWGELFQRLTTMKPKEKGDVFERVVQLYLKTHPEYETKLSEVWMLNEVPKRVRTKLKLPDTDEGIDLIAETKRNIGSLPKLDVDKILFWADEYFSDYGRWPKKRSTEKIKETGDSWAAISSALKGGKRGLKGGITLSQFLSTHRGVKNHKALSPLNKKTISNWVIRHKKRFGEWPTRKSGDVIFEKGETWIAIDRTLGKGRRSMPGGSSLKKLIEALSK